MTEEEFDNYLESIGGLENGFYPDRPKIMTSGICEMGPGWYELVKNLIDELITAGWDKQICQIKEKFGTLRFYVNSASDECYEIISKYEKLSSTVCESCGEPGVIRQGGWIQTLCDEHSGGREPFPPRP